MRIRPGSSTARRRKLSENQTDAERVICNGLRAQGIRVLRFSDYDVLTNWTGVLEVLLEALTPASPTAVGEGQ